MALKRAQVLKYLLKRAMKASEHHILRTTSSLDGLSQWPEYITEKIQITIKTILSMKLKEI
jgi:hypothetical protein